MLEFFKGWRRKTGGVLLVVAIAEWVAIAQRTSIRTGTLEIEATFLTLLAALLLVWSDSPTLEFFRGWRRKTGCVALLMACALMGLKGSEQVVSTFESARMQKDYPNHHLDKDGSMVFLLPEGGTITVMRSSWVPVLCLVVPLTLLSTYLILWQPRKAETSDQQPNINSS